jgi:hypothetical protein
MGLSLVDIAHDASTIRAMRECGIRVRVSSARGYTRIAAHGNALIAWRFACRTLTTR